MSMYISLDSISIMVPMHRTCLPAPGCLDPLAQDLSEVITRLHALQAEVAEKDRPPSFPSTPKHVQ